MGMTAKYETFRDAVCFTTHLVKGGLTYGTVWIDALKPVGRVACWRSVTHEHVAKDSSGRWQTGDPFKMWLGQLIEGNSVRWTHLVSFLFDKIPVVIAPDRDKIAFH